MSDKPFKALERVVADLILGKRWPANTGGPVDVESDRIVGQVKLLKRCSLEELTQFAETIALVGDDQDKHGVLFIKVRRGKGNQSPLLVVHTAEAWKELQDEED